MDNLRENTALILLLFAVSAFLLSCTSAPIAKDGDRVSVNYVGKLTNGKIFDSSEKQGKPLQFVLGSGQMIPGFDAAVKGMKVGEKKEITLSTAEAYGEWKEELVEKLPRNQFPDNAELKQGGILVLTTAEGRKKPARIKEITEEYVAVDLNHPLAGKILQFTITLKDINN